MNVIWIVGKNNYESLKHFESENIIIYDYCDSMPFLYENVDLVLSRSGAMTISELIKFKKPSILVPFKFSSENHQHFNAKFLQDNFCFVNLLLFHQYLADRKGLIFAYHTF